MLTRSGREKRWNYHARAIGFVFFVVIAQTAVFAQQAPTAPRADQPLAGADSWAVTAVEAQARLSLAVSSLNYPVTPGDVYLLSYYQTADNLLSRELLVNGDWEISMGVFGSVNARGLTFTELKRRVEELIAESYSRSLPSLRIVAPGVFSVAVTGEVDRLQYVTAWGLTKLSTIVDRAKGRYSSLRRVEVRSATGRSRSYDLQKALRLGDGGQDPFVRPGDTIVLVPRGRTVELSGEVRHPGSYELLQGEGLRDLIERLGGGTTSDANRNTIRIERNLAVRPRAEYVSIPEAYSTVVRLSDGDRVVVTSRANRRSVVWFEGAVFRPLSDAGTAEAEQMQPEPAASAVPTEGARPSSFVRFSLPIREGELLSDALQEVRDAILPTANLSAATLRHAGETTSNRVDLSSVMAKPASDGDIPLRPNDTIFLPSLPSTVSVFGAVMAPGFFLYEPGEPATYYMGLAGGADPERNARGDYSVTDANGKRRSTSDPINPGDRVYVPLNAAGYRIERTAPTVIAIVAAILNTATFVYLIGTR